MEILISAVATGTLMFGFSMKDKISSAIGYYCYYKYKKNRAYKKIWKSIDNRDYNELRIAIDDLKKVDYKYDTYKTQKILYRLGINEQILLDNNLLQKRFDIEQLYKTDTCSSTDERLDKLTYIVEQSVIMNDRLNL